MMPSFHELVQTLAQKLSVEYDDHALAKQTARWILENVTKEPASKLIAKKDIVLSLLQKKRLEKIIETIINEHKPLAYILGYVPFNGLKILVEPPTLIPRPETEEWVIELLKKLSRLKNKKISILDIGTGTGCVALTLAKFLPNTMVYGIDISPQAIQLARKNADYNNINNAQFFTSDLFSQIPSDLKFDLIVANPPYIAENEWESLEKSVTQWEDKKALIANKSGLEIVTQIIEKSLTHSKRNSEFIKKNMPNLIIEIGHQQGAAVEEILRKRGYTNISIAKDIEGKDRIAEGTHTK